MFDLEVASPSVHLEKLNSPHISGVVQIQASLSFSDEMRRLLVFKQISAKLLMLVFVCCVVFFISSENVVAKECGTHEVLHLFLNSG